LVSAVPCHYANHIQTDDWPTEDCQTAYERVKKRLPEAKFRNRQIGGLAKLGGKSASWCRGATRALGMQLARIKCGLGSGSAGAHLVDSSGRTSTCRREERARNRKELLSEFRNKPENQKLRRRSRRTLRSLLPGCLLRNRPQIRPPGRC